ncbi:MAG: hypothetical protein HY561_09370 [Gemmatimonadetes bacterium]|nr:hypothetical protein [Gemmatimonadota bacterium]
MSQRDRVAVPPGKRPFLLGRRTRRATLLLLLPRALSPLRGPWTVRAIATSNDRASRGEAE